VITALIVNKRKAFIRDTKARALKRDTLKVKALQIWIAYTKDVKEKRILEANLPRKPLVEVNPIIDKDLSVAFLNNNTSGGTLSPRSS